MGMKRGVGMRVEERDGDEGLLLNPTLTCEHTFSHIFSYIFNYCEQELCLPTSHTVCRVFLKECNNLECILNTLFRIINLNQFMTT